METVDWARILPGWLFPAWAGALGLVLGSFANVCIHRLPAHRSVVWARSACPACGRPVRARDNIPLLSYLLLGGRCRDCGAAISARYPLVEGICGALFVLLALQAGPTPGFFVLALFALAQVILFFTDLETMLLPDAVTLTGTAAGLLLAPYNPLLAGRGPARLVSALLGACAGALLVAAIMAGWRLWSRHRLGPDASEEERAGMGMGDLKMLALIGAFVGLRQVFLVTFLAAVMGSLAGLALMAAGRGGRRTALPFGTFLAVAALAIMFFGQPVLGWYLRLLGL